MLYGQLTQPQLSAYLSRVSLGHIANVSPQATLPLLRQLHEAHATTIPFETLSIHGTASARILLLEAPTSKLQPHCVYVFSTV